MMPTYIWKDIHEFHISMGRNTDKFAYPLSAGSHLMPLAYETQQHNSTRFMVLSLWKLKDYWKLFILNFSKFSSFYLWTFN